MTDQEHDADQEQDLNERIAAGVADADDGGEQEYDCTPGWELRCKNANPHGHCGCACGGSNHGVNRRAAWNSPA